MKTKKTLYIKAMKAAEKLQQYLKFFSTDMRRQMRDESKQDPFSPFSAIEDNLTFLINKCYFHAATTLKDKGGQKKAHYQKILFGY